MPRETEITVSVYNVVDGNDSFLAIDIEFQQPGSGLGWNCQVRSCI